MVIGTRTVSTRTSTNPRVKQYVLDLREQQITELINTFNVTKNNSVRGGNILPMHGLCQLRNHSVIPRIGVTDTSSSTSISDH